MVPFESLRTVSNSHSIVIMAVSCIISEIKRDIGRKSRCLHTPDPVYSTPLLGMFPSEYMYCDNVWYGKIKTVWLHDGEDV